MIHTLHQLIPYSNVGTRSPDGRWVRAMHEPFWPGLFGRVKDAWAVLRGPEHAVAVRWPKAGDFEDALTQRFRD